MSLESKSRIRHTENEGQVHEADVEEKAVDHDRPSRSSRLDLVRVDVAKLELVRCRCDRDGDRCEGRDERSKRCVDEANGRYEKLRRDVVVSKGGMQQEDKSELTRLA